MQSSSTGYDRLPDYTAMAQPHQLKDIVYRRCARGAARGRNSNIAHASQRPRRYFTEHRTKRNPPPPPTHARTPARRTHASRPRAHTNITDVVCCRVYRGTPAGYRRHVGLLHQPHRRYHMVSPEHLAAAPYVLTTTAGKWQRIHMPAGRKICLIRLL